MASKGLYDQGPDAIEWQTPPALFDALWDEFGGFDYDPCCRLRQYTADRVLKAGGTICVPPEDKKFAHGPVLLDGLAQAWHGEVFMNPPYARGDLPKWASWAAAQALNGRADLVVALLPVRTDTRWWQEFVCKGANADRIAGPIDEVRFLPKRQTFVGANNQARFASAIVVWSK